MGVALVNSWVTYRALWGLILEWDHDSWGNCMERWFFGKTWCFQACREGTSCRIIRTGCNQLMLRACSFVFPSSKSQWWAPMIDWFQTLCPPDRRAPQTLKSFVGAWRSRRRMDSWLSSFWTISTFISTRSNAPLNYEPLKNHSGFMFLYEWRASWAGESWTTFCENSHDWLLSWSSGLDHHLYFQVFSSDRKR